MLFIRNKIGDNNIEFLTESINEITKSATSLKLNLEG